MKDKPWILILGSNSDMAIACARKYAKSGFNIYLASRNHIECERYAMDFRLRFKVNVEALKFDAVEFENHYKFYNDLEYKPIGVIVAFGIMLDQDGAQKDFKNAKVMIDTNFAGVVSSLEIIAANFEQRKYGFIVGISSVAGDRGRQSNYIYGATKAAMTAYLEGLRHRLFKSGVSVLTVKPGFVATKMTYGIDLPPKLTVQPEHVASAIFKAVRKKKATIYVKPIWQFIMMIVIHLPNFLFHRTKL